jgi:hypothetical protein
MISVCAVLALSVALGCVVLPRFSDDDSTLQSVETAESVSNETVESIPTQNSVQHENGKDYTISVDESEFSSEQLMSAQEVNLNLSFSTSCVTLSELCENAEISVECTVLSVSNTIKEGYPYTKYDVQVDDVLYGDLNVGDKISVVQIGGYMTLQDEIDAYDNSVKFQDISQDERSSILIEKRIGDYPDVGEKYILFLSADNLFEGAYYPVNEYEGVFKYDDSSEKFNRNMPEDQTDDLISVDSDELKASCLNIKNNASLS